MKKIGLFLSSIGVFALGRVFRFGFPLFSPYMLKKSGKSGKGFPFFWLFPTNYGKAFSAFFSIYGEKSGKPKRKTPCANTPLQSLLPSTRFKIESSTCLELFVVVVFVGRQSSHRLQKIRIQNTLVTDEKLSRR